MSQSHTASVIPDVPDQVFTKFLQDLRNAGTSDELINRLHKTLLVDKSYRTH